MIIQTWSVVVAVQTIMDFVELLLTIWWVVSFIVILFLIMFDIIMPRLFHSKGCNCLTCTVPGYGYPQNQKIQPSSSAFNPDELIVFTLSTPFGPTRVAQIGFNDRLDKNTTTTHIFRNVPRIIFIVPGIPTSVDIYREFMIMLYNRLGIPIVVTDQIGLYRYGDMNSATLQDQINHRIYIIEQLIPSSVGIIFISQSIGGYFGLKMMTLMEKHNIIHHLLITPVIHDLVSCEAYVYFKWLVWRIRWLLYVLTTILGFIPYPMTRFILMSLSKIGYAFNKAKNIPEQQIKGLVNFLHWKVVRNLFHTLLDEFKEVTNRDDETIGKNLEKLSFFYVPSDETIPVRLAYDLINTFAGADVTFLDDWMIHIWNLDLKMTQRLVDIVAEKLGVVLRIK